MTEREYILVTNLQRYRDARETLSGVLAHADYLDTEQHKAIMASLEDAVDTITGKLEIGD